MIKVFVSGFFDIVHAGHLQFFREARALGDHLTVSFASAEVLWRQRQRRSSLPDEHKRALIASLGSVDDVVVGTGLDEGLEFKEHFLRLRPQILAVTEEDNTPPPNRLCVRRSGPGMSFCPRPRRNSRRSPPPKLSAGSALRRRRRCAWISPVAGSMCRVLPVPAAMS